MKKQDVRNATILVAVVLGFVGFVVYESVTTRPKRDATRVFLKLIDAVNRPGLSDEERIETARNFFSARRLAAGPIRVADGTVEGLKPDVDHNFPVWRDGASFLLRPTDRDGVVYRMVEENGRWRFDGPAGHRHGRGEFVPDPETP